MQSEIRNTCGASVENKNPKFCWLGPTKTIPGQPQRDTYLG